MMNNQTTVAPRVSSMLTALLNRDLPMTPANVAIARKEQRALADFAYMVVTQASGDLSPAQFRDYVKEQAGKMLDGIIVF